MSYAPGIYITLTEAEKQAEKHPNNPIIQQLLFLMREREASSTEQPVGIMDAAENAVIAYGMGWDMDGVMEILQRAVNGRPRKSDAEFDIYEDVYEQCQELINPHIIEHQHGSACGKHSLTSSVVGSLGFLIEHWLATRDNKREVEQPDDCTKAEEVAWKKTGFTKCRETYQQGFDDGWQARDSVRESSAYKKFFETLWQSYCDMELDLETAEDIRKLGLKLGLIREEKYSEKDHGPVNSDWCMEEGDPIYLKNTVIEGGES